MRTKGHTLIIVEHDKDTILASDYVVELGPAAGEKGGEIVASEPTKTFLKNKNSLTASYLNGQNMILPRETLRKGNGKFLTICGARQFNLKNIDVKIPLGKLVCVTGVSGSGKSTLVHQILYKALAKKFYNAKDPAGEHDKITGLDNIDKVIIVDHLSAKRRAVTPPPIRACFRTSANYSHKCPKPNAAPTRPGGFPLTSRAGGAKSAKATAS